MVSSPFLAMSFELTDAAATVIVGLLVLAGSMWQSWTLSRVHKLVNSNFTEAKAARIAAEAALKTSQDLTIHLQQQLDAKSVAIPTKETPLMIDGR